MEGNDGKLENGFNRRDVLKSSGAVAGATVPVQLAGSANRSGDSIGQKLLAEVRVGVKNISDDILDGINRRPLMSPYNFDPEKRELHIFSNNDGFKKKHSNRDGFVTGQGIQPIPTTLFQGVEKGSLPISIEDKIFPGKRIPINGGFVYPNVKLNQKKDNQIIASIQGPEVRRHKNLSVKPESSSTWIQPETLEVPDFGKLKKEYDRKKAGKIKRSNVPTTMVNSEFTIEVKNRGFVDTKVHKPDEK